MRRSLAAAAAACAVVLGLFGTATPAGAITGNYQKDNEHVYVGMVAFYDASGAFLWRCTGSALNPSTVLTAGHCTDQPAVSARVWFLQDAGANYDPATQTDPTTGYPTSCAAGVAAFCRTSSAVYDYGFVDLSTLPQDMQTHDVGVVTLSSPVTLSSYAKLAAPGSLDAFTTPRPAGQRVTFTLSGYGVSDERPVTVSLRERLMTTVTLVNVASQWNRDGYYLQTSADPGLGQGGSCFGDSGGPVLYGDTDIVTAVNSFVLNGNCAGTTYAYRVDQAQAQQWVLDHAVGPVSVVPLP